MFKLSIFRSTPNHRAWAKPGLEQLESRDLLDNSAALVTGLYTDLLKRAPQPSELPAWQNALDAGYSLGNLASIFLSSQEYETGFITDKYASYLKRGAQPSEMDGWLQAMQAGLSEERLTSLFLASDEYYQRHGATANGWLTSLYSDLFQRSPDSAGFSVWTQALLNGNSRESIAFAFVTCQEANARFVTTCYQQFLGRDPDAAGASGFVAALDSGLPRTSLITGIMGSPEYAQDKAKVSNTQLNFAAPVSYNIGTQPDGFVPNAAPQSVVTGDFNGDGKIDMVVAHVADNSVYFLAGNGDGTFQPAVRIPITVGSIEGSLYAADFNRDGKLDLFLPPYPATGDQPIILLGNGDGTFRQHREVATFDTSSFTIARGWAVGDFNGDGILDLVTGLNGNAPDGSFVSQWSVLLGSSDGTFRRGPSGPLPFGVRWVATGDFNGDGKLDLAFAMGIGAGSDTGSAELTILPGNGDGSFRLGGQYASPGTPGADTLNPEDVFVADLNHDGKLDVIVSDYDQNINVFLGNGDGTFQPVVGYTTGEYPRAVAIADVNGDGKLDLIVGNVGVGPGGAEFDKEGALPGSVAVLLGNGDGTFQSPIQLTPFYYPGWLAVADFNGDGLPDIAVTQVQDGHAVGVMLNQTGRH
jgi:hypothetical protein